MIGSASSQQLLESLLAEIPDDEEEGTKNKSLFNFSSNFTKGELVVLVSVLSGFSKTDFYVKLYSLFGNDTVLFLSMFNGNAVKIPDIRYLLKLKKFSEIHLFLREYRCCEREHCQVKEDLRQRRIKEINERLEDLKIEETEKEPLIRERKELIESYDVAPCARTGFCQAGYDAASKKYKKSEADLRRISSKVETCMKQFRELFNVE